MNTRRSLLGSGAGNGDLLQSNQMTSSRLMKQLTDRVIDVDEFTILRPEGGVQKASYAKISASHPIGIAGSGLNVLSSPQGHHKNSKVVEVVRSGFGNPNANNGVIAAAVANNA